MGRFATLRLFRGRFHPLPAFAVVLLCVQAAAQPESAKTQAGTKKARPEAASAKQKKPDAAELFSRLVEEPTKENYLAARAFVIGHESYKPYSTDVFELGDTKTEAGSRQVLEAIQRCSPNLLFSPRAHLTAAVAAKTLGDEKRSRLEMEITRRLIRAILTTGEGTKNKPYLILRLTDQDDVLMHLRKKQERQSLVQDGGKFDVIRCADGADIWFDVSNIFGRH